MYFITYQIREITQKGTEYHTCNAITECPFEWYIANCETLKDDPSLKVIMLNAILIPEKDDLFNRMNDAVYS